MTIEKGQIRERLRVDDSWLTQNGRVSFFPNAGVVPERKTRFVIQIRLNGDGQQAQSVDIEKLEEDASYTMKMSMVPVAPANTVPLPETYDIENPLIVLQGGADLVGSAKGATGNSIQSSIHYWDDDI